MKKATQGWFGGSAKAKQTEQSRSVTREDIGAWRTQLRSMRCLQTTIKDDVHVTHDGRTLAHGLRSVRTTAEQRLSSALGSIERMTDIEAAVKVKITIMIED